MEKIGFSENRLTAGTFLEEILGEDVCLKLDKDGGGLDLTWLRERNERYLMFWLEAKTTHSVPLKLLVYSNKEDSDEAIFDMQFGIRPNIRTGICIDLRCLDAHLLFPECWPGALKVICHGRRVDRDEVEKIYLRTIPLDNDIQMIWSPFLLTDEYPEHLIRSDGSALPDVKLIDELGQNKVKEWNGKIQNLDEMKEMLYAQYEEVEEGYPFENWTKYGGWKEKKLTEGSGFFSRKKEDGRWWLVDPEGYAFFSMGPDCVDTRIDCRVDSVEKFLDWLPDRNDPEYAYMFETSNCESRLEGEEIRRNCTLFSYEKANLYRAFGEDWHEKWKKMVPGLLRKYGMNTLANWSDPRVLGTTGMPYVTELPKFPGTKQNIFRDFPDVFSEEYRLSAKECAKALEARKDDPLMIGYFLRNEPYWAFVDNLVVADEVLYNPEHTVCKEELIRTLKEKYITIDALNAAWNSSFTCFDDLRKSQQHVSQWTQASNEDMHEFTRRMVREYVSVPVKACREIDKNHMILGMRWAWISDPDLVCGWENFDAYSINCYVYDPTASIQNMVNLGVDLPIMIGEFHFGALDAGPTSTGLEGVASQVDRGKAYRYYCERVAAHTHGVGCHYFQCYDQFELGRFDGENYNCGLFDICSQLYPEMMNAVKECSSTIYEVADGKMAPTEDRAVEAAMIAI